MKILKIEKEILLFLSFERDKSEKYILVEIEVDEPDHILNPKVE
jgi:hypothetical protein